MTNTPYMPCLDCGSLVSCHCFEPGRLMEDLYSETLHAVQTGLGAADTLDLNSSLYHLAHEVQHSLIHLSTK